MGSWLAGSKPNSVRAKPNSATAKTARHKTLPFNFGRRSHAQSNSSNDWFRAAGVDHRAPWTNPCWPLDLVGRRQIGALSEAGEGRPPHDRLAHAGHSSPDRATGVVIRCNTARSTPGG